MMFKQMKPLRDTTDCQCQSCDNFFKKNADWLNSYLIFLCIYSSFPLLLYFIKHPSLFYQQLFHHFKVLMKVQNWNRLVSTFLRYKFITFGLPGFLVFPIYMHIYKVALDYHQGLICHLKKSPILILQHQTLCRLLYSWKLQCNIETWGHTKKSDMIKRSKDYSSWKRLEKLGFTARKKNDRWWNWNF